MILHRCIGVGYSDISVGTVSGDVRYLEQHFQVHQVIDNDRKPPSSLGLPVADHVPTLYATDFFVETCNQSIGSIYQHLFVLLFAGYAISLSVGVVEDKAE